MKKPILTYATLSFQLLCAFLLVVCVFGCREEEEEIPAICLIDPTREDCPNYDRCFFNVAIETAEWDMVDTSGNAFSVDSTIAFVMDTAWNLRAATMFRPRFVDERAIYRWQIGLDPRIWETSHLTPPQGFFREFEGAIDVTLEIEQPDTEGCLTDEEAIKSFTKTVYFRDVLGSEYPGLGTYLGQFTDRAGNPVGEERELAMVMDGDDVSFNIYLQGITFPEPCGLINEEGIELAGSLYQYVSKIVRQSYECTPAIRPIVLVDLDRETATQLTVRIWHDDVDTGERVFRQFVGERV
jgi:hypothetical protein